LLFLIFVVDCCLLYLVIMSSVPSAPEVLKSLLLAKDALLGQTWLQTTCIPLSADSLHHLVLASKIPLVVKARDAYGHSRTASQMNKVPSKYWQPEPALSTLIQQESLGLNPKLASNPLVPLNSLHLHDIGRLLVVTQQFAADGISMAPYITVVVAPSMATLGTFEVTHPTSLAYSDFWDEEVLTPYNIPEVPGPHCPSVAAA
jgi:hypothetical protein